MSSAIRNRQGDVAWQYIIGGALAIMVLVVMIMIFTGAMGRFGKNYNKAEEPAVTAAEKAGWCISTLTEGKRCEYEMDCSAIAGQVGGKRSYPATTEEQKKNCGGTDKMHAYSSSKNQLCCVEFA